MAGVHCKEIVMDKNQWWAEIGGQQNFYMNMKGFWLRTAQHYRDPFWRDVSREMHALRQIRKMNASLRKCITL
jgi:hypothetical protein